MQDLIDQENPPYTILGITIVRGMMRKEWLVNSKKESLEPLLKSFDYQNVRDLIQKFKLNHKVQGRNVIILAILSFLHIKNSRNLEEKISIIRFSRIVEEIVFGGEPYIESNKPDTFENTAQTIFKKIGKSYGIRDRIYTALRKAYLSYLKYEQTHPGIKGKIHLLTMGRTDQESYDKLKKVTKLISKHPLLSLNILGIEVMGWDSAYRTIAEKCRGKYIKLDKNTEDLFNSFSILANDEC